MSQDVGIEKFWCFLENRPLMVEFSKLCFKSLHVDTDGRCCVLIIS